MTKALLKKRYFALALLLVFSALLILSPFLISSTSALRFFVSKVNTRLPGKLTIESWLIGWQQGVLCKNVVYTDPARGISISIPTLTSNRGLLELVLAPKNFGVVQLESPQMKFSGSTLHTFFAHGLARTTQKDQNIVRPGNSSPFWERLAVDLKSRDGRVDIGWDDQDISVSVTDMSVDTRLAGGVVDFDVDFQTMDQGFVEASGKLNMPAHEQGWLETIITQADVKVSSLELAGFLRAGAAIAELPLGNGILNADVQVNTVGIDDIEISGLAELTDVSLRGGWLDGDQPSFKMIHLDIDEGKWTNLGWSVNDLEFISDTLNMELSGELLEDSTQLQASGTVILPILFDQFPRLLNINESTFVETGIFDYSLDVATGKTDQSVKFKAKADNIGGVFQGKQFAWESPTVFLLNGGKSEEKVEISALQFDAPFARAKGSGDQHSFVLDAELDIHEALNELGTLFQIDMSGSGEMELTIKSSPVQGEKERFKVDTDLSMHDFMLQNHDQQVIPLHQLSLISALTAPDTIITDKTGEVDLQFVLSSWLGEMFLVLNGDVKEKGGFRGYFTTDSEFDLAQVSSLLHIFGLLDSESKVVVSGDTQLQAAGFIGESSLEIRDISSEITNFSIKGNEALFMDPRIQIQSLQPVNEEVMFLSVRDLKVVENRDTFFRQGGGLNLIDFSAGNISLHNVSIKGDSGEASLKSLVMPDWQKPFEFEGIQLFAAVDLAKMTTGFHALGLLPANTGFAGFSSLRFHLAGKDEANREAVLQVEVTDFSMKRNGKNYTDSEDITFSSRVVGRFPFGDMNVEEMGVDSNTMIVKAKGKVAREKELQVLELRGTIRPMLERIGLIIGSEFDYDLKMQGQREEQFDLKYPLWGKPGRNIDKLKFSSSMHSEQIIWNDMELKDVSLPFHFDNNVLNMELSGLMNGGMLKFISDTDFVHDPPVMKVPVSQQVLAGVKITDSLVRQLLSRFHPLFGGMAEPSGNIDVKLDSFWWPLGEGNQSEANFVLILDVAEMEVRSLPPLEQILDLFGLERDKLELKDNEIYCIGKDGGIKCSPVRLQTGGAEIDIGGTVFSDRSIDYTIRVPVTRKLLNEEGYRILAGSVIEVAMQGTIEDPVFDKEKVVSSIQNLMKKAAEKIEKERDNAE